MINFQSILKLFNFQTQSFDNYLIDTWLKIDTW